MKQADLPIVLDPCCGSRMMWFNRTHPDVLYADNRAEEQILCDGRVLKVDPDLLADFRDMPYPDESFKLVAFDPPHLKSLGDTSWMKAKYGKLGKDWKEDIRAGFSECFRVLEKGGVLVFKWNESQIKIREIMALTTERPLFGNTSGKRAGTHWIVFLKGI